ncbi:MAG: hypothetical protein KBD17_00730 [Candidatus Pacebacteria bacterium]|nr:hypothetical protein [Candidatus Paceibacterota bacterium]
MKSSLDKLASHVPDIERRDKQLGGFLTLFKDLTGKQQSKVMDWIKELKARSLTEDEIIQEVRVQTKIGEILEDEMYKHTGSSGQSLTFKIEELEQEAQKHIKH